MGDTLTPNETTILGSLGFGGFWGASPTPKVKNEWFVTRVGSGTNPPEWVWMCVRMLLLWHVGVCDCWYFSNLLVDVYVCVRWIATTSATIKDVYISNLVIRMTSLQEELSYMYRKDSAFHTGIMTSVKLLTAIVPLKNKTKQKMLVKSSKCFLKRKVMAIWSGCK